MSTATTAERRCRSTAARRGARENNQPTGQYYHVSLDDQFPFHVYGAQQDEGAYEGPSATSSGSIGIGDWHVVALGESTFVASEPANADVTYGAGYFSTLARLDSSVGQQQNVSPWPRYQSGATRRRDEVSLRVDASDLFLAGRSEGVAHCGASRVFEHRSRQDVEDLQPGPHARRQKHGRPERRTGRSGYHRRRSVSRHRIARGLAAQRGPDVGRFGRRTGARDEGSRRALGTRYAARVYRSGRRSVRSNRRTPKERRT